MAEEFDYYAFLEVPPDADEATIRMAYRTLARRYHPDIAGDGSLERMQQLNVAYYTLSDPDRRRAYDAQRPDRSAQASASKAGQTRSATTPSASTSRTGVLSATSGPLARLATLDAASATPVTALSFAWGGRQLGLGLIDGTIQIWDVASLRSLATLSFGSGMSAGVLHELRLSPQGIFAAAWGFRLGMRIWHIPDGRTVWNTAINAPGGMLDLTLGDAPPLARMALPDAPLALADDDAFRWAHEGRRGTAILSRPLGGPVDPAWAIPLQCLETTSTGLFGNAPDDRWRIHQRMLSSDGRLLLTFSTGRASRFPTARVLHLWELDHRTMRGAVQARRAAEIALPVEHLHFPLAATSNLAWVACGHLGRAMRLSSLREGKHITIPTGDVAEDSLAALSPDARYLALARGPQLDLWETHSARHVQQWRFSAEITSLTAAPGLDKPLYAVGLRNGVTDLWG
ncbi:MAG: J domain-containing protein [Ktedonobacterales bacterium]